MAEIIRVDTSYFNLWASGLSNASEALSDAARILGQVDTGDGWWRKVRVNANVQLKDEGGSERLTDARSAVADLQSVLRRYESRLEKLSGAVRQVGADFAAAESDVKAVFMGAEDASASNIYNAEANAKIPGSGSSNYDWNSIIKNTVISKSQAMSDIIKLVAPMSGLMFITSGIFAGKTPSFFDYSRTPSSGASADWLGYEFDEGNPGVTAWLGKASAHAQNEVGYAGVNAYLGKAEASAKADGGFMKTTTKKEFKDGKWVEKSVTEFLYAEASAGAGVSILAADAEAGVGSDMLGLEGKAEGSVGNAEINGKAKFSISDNGRINANVSGKAMVSAAEGEISGTINILGLEITGTAGGYAGAVGVEGTAGFVDGDFVIKGGAAAGMGGSLGLQIGFNEEGWDNFVDYIIFWD